MTVEKGLEMGLEGIPFEAEVKPWPKCFRPRYLKRKEAKILK
jgi:hypothetical protein